jgi:hypothetical protein
MSIHGMDAMLPLLNRACLFPSLVIIIYFLCNSFYHHLLPYYHHHLFSYYHYHLYTDYHHLLLIMILLQDGSLSWDEFSALKGSLAYKEAQLLRIQMAEF